MATMDDIARRLGISKGTVSKALSGAEDVSESMRNTVLETAVEMGYNRISRNKSPGKICVFIENMAYEKPEDFGWELVTGFRKMAEPEGFQVDLIPMTAEEQKQRHYDEYMLLHGYKGAFFLGLTLSDPWMEDFQTCRTPAVLYDNRIPGNSVITHVSIDTAEGMDMAVAYLKSLGHTRIGYLSDELGSYVYQQRYDAFFQSMRRNGLEAAETLGRHSYFTTERLEKHLPALLELGCTAIICSHDVLAHTVMIHCREQGMKLPEDLSIIGFDDIPLCRFTTPQLTSVRQDRTELGKSAFYALSSQFKRIPISTLQLHPQLIERDSAGRVMK